jgi:glycerophosphoryl diester phosphodiesterase
MISLRASEITLGFIQQCRRFGILALAWDFIKTQNPIALMQQIAELGIDGILFDDPATAHQMRTDKETFLNIS